MNETVEVTRRRGLRGLALPAASLAAGSAALVVIWFADPTSKNGFPLPPCPVKWLCGLNCPGCGTGRMLYSLLHGDVAAALQFNALALVFIPLFLWAWIGWTVHRFSGRRVFTWEDWRWAPFVALGMLAVWTVVRNLPFPPFSHLYV